MSYSAELLDVTTTAIVDGVTEFINSLLKGPSMHWPTGPARVHALIRAFEAKADQANWLGNTWDGTYLENDIDVRHGRMFEDLYEPHLNMINSFLYRTDNDAERELALSAAKAVYDRYVALSEEAELSTRTVGFLAPAFGEPSHRRDEGLLGALTNVPRGLNVAEARRLYYETDYGVPVSYEVPGSSAQGASDPSTVTEDDRIAARLQLLYEQRWRTYSRRDWRSRSPPAVNPERHYRGQAPNRLLPPRATQHNSDTTHVASNLRNAPSPPLNGARISSPALEPHDAPNDEGVHRYIDLLREYAMFAQGYCYSLYFRFDRHRERHPDKAATFPLLEAFRSIGAHMLSDDFDRLNRAAKIYEEFMIGCMEHLILVGDYDVRIYQDVDEIPVLPELCRIIHSDRLRADTTPWYRCILAHTGMSSLYFR